MEDPTNSDSEIVNELEKARIARESGNEGKSRVCARRATGMAIRKYADSSELSAKNSSSFEIIRSFANIPDLPPNIVNHANNLTRQVSPSFALPEGIDLIRDAISLYNYLSGKTINIQLEAK